MNLSALAWLWTLLQLPDFGALDIALLVPLVIVAIFVILKVFKYIFIIAIIAAVYFAWKFGLLQGLLGI